MAVRKTKQKQSKRMVKKRTSKKLESSPIKRGGAGAQTPIPPADSYEHAMIRIIQARTHLSAVQLAVTQCNLLCSLTPALAEYTVRYGMLVGRTLYSSIEQQPRYADIGDYLSYIARFFEQAGYEHVTFELLTNTVRIRIYRADHINIGANIHKFDAGIIAGFISAAANKQTDFEEAACSNNGSQYCEFIMGQPGHTSTGASALQHFSQEMPAALAGRYKTEISSAYLALNYMPFVDHAFETQVNLLMKNIGSVYAKSLSGFLKTPAKVEQLFAILGMGDAKLNSRRPLSINITFNQVLATKRFTDVVYWFTTGLFGCEAPSVSLKTDKKAQYMLTIKNR